MIGRSNTHCGVCRQEFANVEHPLRPGVIMLQTCACELPLIPPSSIPLVRPLDLEPACDCAGEITKLKSRIDELETVLREITVLSGEAIDK